MRISDLENNFGFEAMFKDYSDQEISSGYTSDLLSDVMSKAKTGSVLITIQAHKNTVAVATLVGANSIVICNGRPIPDEMTASARDEGIALFRTDQSQFEVSGQVYTALRDQIR